MAFRGKEMMKKLLKKVGEKNLAHGVKEQLQKSIPDSKVVMNRAKRGLYAGRHIQFGNSISEDGGNKTQFRDLLQIWLEVVRYRLGNSEYVLVVSDFLLLLVLSTFKKFRGQFVLVEITSDMLYRDVMYPRKHVICSGSWLRNWLCALRTLISVSELVQKRNEIFLYCNNSNEIFIAMLKLCGLCIHWEILTSCNGCDRSRRSWKPNVQEKRLFSYILDRHIRVKVTTHALRCIDKAGGIDEYLLKTPYHKMDTEMGLFWKAKIEKMYEELGQMEVVFFSPEDEAKFEQGFKDLKLAERAARRDARRQMYGWSGKLEEIENRRSHDGTGNAGEDSSDGDVLAANS
ncbi:hypothetical protein Goshw_030303 [Gossypium schwendimanii]|uniref:Large ribosomal subunit protein bL28m n=2 Tax=Gossypium TaxID=3633 RepID=A0A7J9KPD9_GOSSC|nr:hypothetical protein [Gossypium schwendimanii]